MDKQDYDDPWEKLTEYDSLFDPDFIHISSKHLRSRTKNVISNLNRCKVINRNSDNLNYILSINKVKPIKMKQKDRISKYGYTPMDMNCLIRDLRSDYFGSRFTEAVICSGTTYKKRIIYHDKVYHDKLYEFVSHSYGYWKTNVFVIDSSISQKIINTDVIYVMFTSITGETDVLVLYDDLDVYEILYGVNRYKSDVGVFMLEMAISPDKIKSMTPNIVYI